MLHDQHLPTAPTLRTALKNLADGRYDDVWAKNSRLKIRGSVRKAPKVFAAIVDFTSPDQILCDVVELDRIVAPFLKKRTFPSRCGFKSFQSFRTWHSNTRSFFDVVSGRRSSMTAIMAQEDEWTVLIAHLSGLRGSPRVLSEYEMLAIFSLVRECRIRGIGPADLRAETIEAFAPHLRPGTKNAIKRACERIDSLRADSRVPREFLPPAPIGKLLALSGPQIRTVPPLSDHFSALLDSHVEALVRGSKTAFFGTMERTVETKAIGEDREKNIRVAIRWYWHGLVALGLASPDTRVNLKVIAEPVVLHDVVRACAQGRLGAICDGETRRARVMMVISFLDRLAPGYGAKIGEAFFEDRSLGRDPTREKSDAAFKEETCLEFIHDRSFQHRFFSLPLKCVEEARPLIAKFGDLGPVDGRPLTGAQHRALDLALMAALTAITTRFPGRLKTLVRLDCGGPRPHILFPEKGFRSKDVVLDIPGYIVKNGHHASGIPLMPARTISPRRILQWYMAEARPLVLRHKSTMPSLMRPEKLFCGLHIETLRRIWRRHASEAGLVATPHMCRHLIASLLYARGVPIEHIAELLGDSVDMTAEAYTFVDRATQIQGVMDAQAKVFKELGL